MASAQAALEYLIIIAAILGISAVIVLISASTASGGVSTVLFNTCKEAAAHCNVLRQVAINDPCLNCVQSCSDPKTGQELFTGAVNCCNSTMIEKIYPGSGGCPAYTPP